jgi:hypothetical protein
MYVRDLMEMRSPRQGAVTSSLALIPIIVMSYTSDFEALAFRNLSSYSRLCLRRCRSAGGASTWQPRSHIRQDLAESLDGSRRSTSCVTGP